MKNTGLHHISVLSSNAKKAYDFYHRILGLKLILKTVNQDDPAMYHLFFGDNTGRAGTEFTVFEMKGMKANQFGSNAIERTLFLVASEAALTYWEQRLEVHGVCHYGIETYGDQKILRFDDEDGQRLGLVYRDVDMSKMDAYVAENIPAEFAILGLGDVMLRVRYPEATAKWLTETFGYQHYDTIEAFGQTVQRYRFVDGIFNHEVHVIEDKTSPIQRLGVGGIHHVAFGVESRSDLEELEQLLENRNIINSGIVNREFILSSYFREANYNLFEVATPLEEATHTVQQQGLAFEDVPLFLPEFLENRREEIQGYLDYEMK